jgi:hypothetical protein
MWLKLHQNGGDLGEIGACNLNPLAARTQVPAKPARTGKSNGYVPPV